MKPSALERLKAQRAKLDARIQASSARAKVIARKKDTRRKILVGAFYLDKAIQEGKTEALKSLMDRYLTRESDRKLFDLYTKTEQIQQTEEA